MYSGIETICRAANPNLLGLESVAAHTAFTVVVLLVAPALTAFVVSLALAVPMILAAFVAAERWNRVAKLRGTVREYPPATTVRLWWNLGTGQDMPLHSYPSGVQWVLSHLEEERRGELLRILFGVTLPQRREPYLDPPAHEVDLDRRKQALVCVGQPLR